MLGLGRCLLVIAMAACVGRAAEPPPAPPQSPAPSDPLVLLPPEEARELLQWGVDMVRQLLPETYTSDKHWAKKKRIQVGIKLRAEDGKLKTSRRHTEVGHGRWVRYTVRLRDPTDPNQLEIRVLSAEMDDAGRLQLAAEVDLMVDLDLHQQRWNLGTRLWRFSVDAEAKLRLEISGSVGFDFDITRIPPDVLISPQVDSARVDLADLKVKRISKLNGDIAESVGDLAASVIRHEYLPKQDAKLVDKLNRQIERKRDRLRISASDWLNRKLSTNTEPGRN